MANPIAFQVEKVDPRVNLQKRLDAAPDEHAEALLVAWDLMQAMHDQGLLDTVHGMVRRKTRSSARLREYGKQPEGVAAIRNLIALARVLMTIDPEMLDSLARAVASAGQEHARKKRRRAFGSWRSELRARTADGGSRL